MSTYSPKFIPHKQDTAFFTTYLPILVAILLRFASGSTAGISYIVLAILSLFGNSQAIIAISLSWLFTMISPALVPEESGGGAGRYVVLVAVAISSLVNGRSNNYNAKIEGFAVYTVFLGAFIVLHSILVSPILDVSLLKAVSWTFAVVGILGSWLRLSSLERDLVARKLYWGLTSILLVSLPFLATSQGFLRNGTGFQGILNHPQSFGATMSLLGVWSFSRMLGERTPSWSSIVLTGTSVVLILLSESRSAGLSMVIGAGLAIVLSPIFAGTSLIKIAPGFRSGRVWGVLALSFFAGIGLLATLNSVFDNFISKSNRSDATGLVDAYEGSRGLMIDLMLINIKNNPWFGIGFGIASTPSMMEVDRDPLLGLPVGAAVEKGVAPVAILEEIGVAGALLTFFWVIYLLRGSSRGGLAPFAVCMTALLFNMGENTLFSPGGQGLIVLVLFGWAYASGRPTHAHDR